MKRIICLMLICLLLAGCGGARKAERTVFAMDTVMQLSVWGGDAEEACDRIEALLADVEKSYSAERLNSGSLTPEQSALLARAEELKGCTGGAFDPQMYGIMQAWGFDTKNYRVPTDEELENAPRLWDLGAAAKGWAGDLAVDILEELDVTCALLNLGGNVQTYGTKADRSPWAVGIRDPEGEKEYLAVVSVEGTMSIVTSGDYQRYFEENGVKYHHIMDPQTGRPADSGLRSVTVICGDGMTADALSTALFVMGLEKATEFWRQSDDFEAIFVTTDGQLLATQGVRLSECAFEVIER